MRGADGSLTLFSLHLEIRHRARKHVLKHARHVLAAVVRVAARSHLHSRANRIQVQGTVIGTDAVLVERERVHAVHVASAADAGVHGEMFEAPPVFLLKLLTDRREAPRALEAVDLGTVDRHVDERLERRERLVPCLFELREAPTSKCLSFVGVRRSDFGHGFHQWPVMSISCSRAHGKERAHSGPFSHFGTNALARSAKYSGVFASSSTSSYAFGSPGAWHFTRNS